MESEPDEPEHAAGNVEDSSGESEAYSPGSQHAESESGDGIVADDDGDNDDNDNAVRDAKATGEGPRRLLAARRRKDVRTKALLDPAYRDLLNETILEIATREAAGTPLGGLDRPALPSSQIAGSHWTGPEKSRFFATLAAVGPGNFPALARAVGSKSEVEVGAYVSLLQQGAEEVEAGGKVGERFEVWDVEAAVEVGGECVAGEETVAEKLGRLVERAERKRDARLGEWGVVGEEEAERLDGMVEGTAAEGGGGEADAEVAGDGAKTEDGSHDADAETPPDQEPGPIPATLPVPAAALLRPSAFLILSRKLFMNSADPSSNWQHLLDPTSPQAGPAIHSTAINDFHNLTANLTRRLVQATTFQALSRLRAATDARTVPGISAADVRGAVDILGLPRNGKEIWAKTARKCGVEVYSEAKRFRDGRDTWKTGVKLEYDEVEAELGFAPPGGEGEVAANEHVEELERDEDAFTETDGSDGSDSDDDGDEAAAPNAGKTKRKRALSPHAYDKAEDQYLDRLDWIASLKEENRLREILDLEPLPEPEAAEPEMQFKRAKREERRRAWRDAVGYKAPWETVGFVREEEFEDMEGRGRRGRGRREKARQLVGRKFERDGEESGDGDGEEGEDVEMEDYDSEGNEAEEAAGMEAEPAPVPESEAEPASEPAEGDSLASESD